MHILLRDESKSFLNQPWWSFFSEAEKVREFVPHSTGSESHRLLRNVLI